jgi:ATP-binding protein involved in chromosome partitioning
MISNDDVLKVLSTVMEPELHQDLISLKMVEEIQIKGSTVSFKIILTTPRVH